MRICLIPFSISRQDRLFNGFYVFCRPLSYQFNQEVISAKKIRLHRRSNNILYGIQLSRLLSLFFLVIFWYYYIRAYSQILYIVLSSGNFSAFSYMCRTVWSVNFLWDIMTHNQKKRHFYFLCTLLLARTRKTRKKISQPGTFPVFSIKRLPAIRRDSGVVAGSQLPLHFNHY